MSGTKQLKSEIKTGGKEILLRDIRPYIIGEKCMLLISHSKKDNRNERLLTKFTIDTKSLKEGMKYPDYSTKDLMEYETFGPVDEIGAVSIWAEESCIISVIEKNEDSNSIILLKDNRHGYVEGLIKISMETDIYWHDIFVRDNYIRVVYTVRDKDRFTIKTVKYNIKDHMISKETTVRERMACSHPLFVEYMGELWICWYENGAVYSCVIDENGSIEKPLKRKDSAGKKLMYTHFLTDSISLKKRFDFNAGKVFVTYPENRMTGFGRPKF